MTRLLTALFLLLSIGAYSQTIITGTIIDASRDEPLGGAHVLIEGKVTGTISDQQGNFTLNTTSPLPFNLIISMIGFEDQKITIESGDMVLDIALEEAILVADEVIVAASRVEESILQSSVSVERVGILDIRQTSSDNFYTSLANIKGVDVNTQSLLFRFPNARGFNGASNFRFNQLIDGIDNAPPGLNFAAGNIFGLNQLDVESMELIVGASSALYGPGGMNGTLLMTSKNPFEYQGLSAQVQTGLMNVGAPEASPSPMVDANIRYAKSINDKFAFKISIGYLQALDWHASDKRNKNDLSDPNLDHYTNPGYDGVNVYGDEVVVPVNMKSFEQEIAEGVADQQFQPGTPEYDNEVERVKALVPDQLITRTGYDEKDLVDYNTQNLRIGGSLHYRLTEDLELSLQGNYATGTSVYTAQSRFSLQNFKAFTSKLELRSSNFFARVWMLSENAGDTYDAGNSASQLNEIWKSSADWYADYIAAFTQSYIYPGGSPINNAYRFSREVADNRTQEGIPLVPGGGSRPLPGTPEFDAIWNDITGKPRTEGGGLVIDRSAMYHAEGMYDFSKFFNLLSLQVGVSHRVYNLNSEGTIFIDTPGNPIIQHQFGAYAQAARGFFADRLRLTLSGRWDDNSSFEGNFTPRFSVVYSMDKSQEHNVRISAQSAFRFPATSDQWLNFSLGELDIEGRQFQFNVIGGNREVQDLYGLHDGPVFALSGNNPFVGVPESEPFIIPEFRAETVSAFEIGYKGMYLNRMLFLDAYFYHNTYNGFHAKQALVQNPGGANESRFITTISTDQPISTYGWAVGADFNLPKGYLLKTNISNNSLSSANDIAAGFQTRFNTPEYRINLSIGNYHLTERLGFNVTWHWQEDFLWESDFGVATIPSYNTLDAQVSWKLTGLSSSVKVGASNLLNNYYYTGFGNAQIGGLYYVTLSFDQYLN